MVKKILIWIGVAIIAAGAAVLGIFADQIFKYFHECNFSTEYSYDETHHWLECNEDICDEVKDKAEHIDENEDTICDICFKGAKAVVNGTPYIDIHNAIETAEIGSIIKLLDNIELDQSIRINKQLTLDLNGKTITRESTNTQTILVLADGDLTITGDGIINGASAIGSASIGVYVYGGTLTINSGHFTNIADDGIEAFEVIYTQNGGNVTINGGFFEGEDLSFMLNQYDTDRATSPIIVKGGTFVNFNPGDNLAEGVGTNFVADGYEVIQEVQENGDIWYTVVVAE